MNDREITDFDKLKNTLIEIGVDFYTEIVHDSGWKGVFIDSDLYTTGFWFNSEGEYQEVCCD